MPSIPLAVVILNYNGLNYLKKFLPQLILSTPEAEIFVADNGSVDGSIEWLKTLPMSVKVLAFNENHGFCKGYNLALSQINATYAILLNSDVWVEAGWASKLVSEMESNPKIAACGPKILDYSKKDFFEYAGACGGFIDWLGYPFCRGRIFDSLEQDIGQYEQDRQVFWASGACLMVRLQDYWQVGGLEERFFAHMEEIDLCWKLQHAGYQIWNFPKSKIWHVGGATLHKSSPLKTFLNFRNGLAMLYKNYTGKYLLGVVILRMVLDGLAGIRLLIGGQPKHVWAIIRAHFSFYKNLSYWKSKRNKMVIKDTFRMSIFQKSIVKTYFIDKKQTFDQLDF